MLRNEGRVYGVHHVVLERVWGQVQVLAKPFGNVTAGFGSSAEEGGAGFPSHLQGSRDHNHDLRIGVIRIGGQDIAKLFLLRGGHTHAPETILNVELAKQEGPLIRGSGAHCIDDTAQGSSEFMHGGHGSRIFIGQVVHRSGGDLALPALAFVGEVEDHSEQAAFVGDGRDGTDFGVGFAALQYSLSKLGPWDKAGKVLVNFLQRFGAKSCGSHRVFSGRVGTITYSLVKLLEGPVVDNVDRATLGSKLLEHWSSRVLLGKFAGVHKATSGNMRVRLTLCFGENLIELIKGDWCNGIRYGGCLGHGARASSGRVPGGRAGVDAALRWGFVRIGGELNGLAFGVVFDSFLGFVVGSVEGLELLGGSSGWHRGRVYGNR